MILEKIYYRLSNKFQNLYEGGEESMEPNVDRSSWGMGALALGAAAIGALLIFVPESIDLLFDKITAMIAKITL